MSNENRKSQTVEVETLKATVAALEARITALEAVPARTAKAPAGPRESLDSVTLRFLREKSASAVEIRDRIQAEKSYLLRSDSTPDRLLETTIRRLREKSGLAHLGAEVKPDSDGRYYDVAAWEAEQAAVQATA